MHFSSLSEVFYQYFFLLRNHWSFIYARRLEDILTCEPQSQTHSLPPFPSSTVCTGVISVIGEAREGEEEPLIKRGSNLSLCRIAQWQRGQQLCVTFFLLISTTAGFYPSHYNTVQNEGNPTSANQIFTCLSLEPSGVRPYFDLIQAQSCGWLPKSLRFLEVVRCLGS